MFFAVPMLYIAFFSSMLCILAEKVLVAQPDGFI
jgi:hypothetical protein